MSVWDPAGKVDVMDMLEILEIDNVRPEGLHEARFSCPFPGHDNGDMSASCYMNVDTTAWYCHGCKRKGTAVNFSAHVFSISPMKAKRLLRQAYDPSSFNPDERNMVDELREFFASQRKKQRKVENTPFEETYLEKFDVDWEAVADADESVVPDSLLYMPQRGFKAETLDAWRFGLDQRTERVTFPVYDEEGRLIGMKGRTTTGHRAKYMMLGDAEDWDKPIYGFPRYAAGNVIFGLHRVDSADLIVCEGELNVVALWQMGYHNAVALNGSNLTQRQAKLLRRHADRATFYFDPDSAGDRGLWGYEDEDTGEHKPGALEILARDIPVRVVGSFDEDAADAMQNGNQDDVHELIDQAESYVQVALRRRRAAC